MRPRLLAFAASYRSSSVNLMLLKLAITHEGTPALPAGATMLADALLSHDGLLLASPEYNWSIPASLKNLIDWISTDTRLPFYGKPALLLSATPSSRGGVTGLKQLRTPLMNLNMWVYPQLIGIGSSTGALTEAGLTSAKDREYLQTHVNAFVSATRKLSAD
jgi:chromate reductase, NAD(P)H dehydrogenase (quinone)